MPDSATSGLGQEQTRSGRASELTLNCYQAGTPTRVGGGLPRMLLHGGGPWAVRSSLGAALPGFAQDVHSGHWAQLEVAEEFREVVSAFSARHSERPSGGTSAGKEQT